MRYLLAPVGSAGDVYPFLGLGTELQRRGHDVTLMTSGYFAAAARSANLSFVDCLSAEDFLVSVQHPDLWHPRRGFRHVFQRCLVPHLRRQYDLTLEHACSNTVVVSSCLGLGMRVAQETHARRLLTVHLQPAVLWSRHQPPQLPNMPSGPWIPNWIKHGLFTLGRRTFVDAVALPELNRFRAPFGLRPIESLMEWWNSPDGIVGLFPDWYAPHQPDWPRGFRTTCFPCWTEGESEGLSEVLQAFLDGGDPPIAFTPGSAMAFGARFFEVAHQASVRLGRRAIFVTRFDDQIPRHLPPSILHVPYAPFGALLPRVAAIVHHGGVGTTSQAMARGIPQLIMPMSHDQPDNAARIKRLGVGDWLSPRRFTPRAVASRLAWLLTDLQVAASCRDIASKMRGPDPFFQIGNAVESLSGLGS